MVSNVYLLFSALQLAYVLAVDEGGVDRDIDRFYATPNLKKIQNEMFWRMSQFTQGLWNVTPSDQNIQFFPILDAINTNLALMYLYHQYGLASLFSKNLFLERPLELATLLSKLQTSIDTRLFLQIQNSVFFTRNCTNEDYLRDLKTYYQSVDVRDVTQHVFGKYNTAPITPEMLRWLNEDVLRREMELEEVVTPGFTDYHISILHFSACFDIPMVKSDDLLFDLSSRRVESILQIPTTKFENQTKQYVDAFSSNDLIGYFHDTLSGYEAISLPQANNRIATVVVLPRQNQTLKMFVNFTAQDYEQLFERVSTNFQHIEFIIPSLRISMVTMNENKITINYRPHHSCDYAKKRTGSGPTSDYKKFVVDRPYGVFIYHVKTKFVLWQGWIRDPTSTKYVLRRFFNHTSAMARELDLKYIS